MPLLFRLRYDDRHNPSIFFLLCDLCDSSVLSVFRFESADAVHIVDWVMRHRGHRGVTEITEKN